MADQFESWSFGDRISIEEVVRGKLWIRRPAVVIVDDSEALVVAMVTGSTLDFPADLEPRGRYLDMWRSGRWTLTKREFLPPTTFRILPPDRSFDVWFDLDTTAESPRYWYVNFQRPIVRNSGSITTADWILDIEANIDGKSIRIKDSDEFDRAVALGVFDAHTTEAIQDEVERLTRQMRSGSLPWDKNWPARVRDMVDGSQLAEIV